MFSEICKEKYDWVDLAKIQEDEYLFLEGQQLSQRSRIDMLINILKDTDVGVYDDLEEVLVEWVNDSRKKPQFTECFSTETKVGFRYTGPNTVYDRFDLDDDSDYDPYLGQVSHI
jgi:hypothetical protein